MGEYADMMLDMMIDCCDEWVTDIKNYNYTIWRTITGSSVSIKEMTESHLDNCIKMLSKSVSPLKDGYIKAMELELNNRRKEDNNKMEKILNVLLSVVGVTFQNDDGSSRNEIIATKMTDSTTVELVREPTNKFDKNAIKVVTDCGQIGYIGKEYATIIAKLMDNGDKFSAVVSDYGVFKDRPYCKITINQI